MTILEPGEEVVLEIRHHWYIFSVQIIPIVMLVLAPLLVVVLPQISVAVGFTIIMGNEVLFLAATWWLLLWMIFGVVWTNYYLDVWIVTNRRVIDVEQYGLFNRKVSECRLDRVQDVSVEVNGFLPTMMHFGTVRVQTAGENQEFVMRNVPNPDAVRDAIFQHLSR